MKEFILNIHWGIVFILCISIGLAPFTPPHIWEKLNMLVKGTLKKPIDWFDFLFHSLPWIILIAKSVLTIRGGD